MTPERLWEEYKREGGDGNEYLSWAFCGGGKEADLLLELVKEGKKRGTASALIAYENEKEPLPKEGDLSIVLDSTMRAHLIIRTRKITLTPFVSVHPYHAYLEGEGDCSLDYWRGVHRKFFTPDYALSSLPFDERGEVVLEEFDVVYPAKYRDKDEIYLTLPTKDDAWKYEEYKKEFALYSSSMDGTGALSSFDDYKAWVDHENGMWDEKNVKDGYVPSTTLLAVRRGDKRVVGMTNIRHCLNDKLMLFGGNIGYSVRPTERNKGYGKKILSLALPYARSLKINRVLITCNSSNEASRRIIQSSGGVYLDTLKNGDRETERYWIET